jgi:hypothetical protein
MSWSPALAPMENGSVAPIAPLPAARSLTGDGPGGSPPIDQVPSAPLVVRANVCHVVVVRNRTPCCASTTTNGKAPPSRSTTRPRSLVARTAVNSSRSVVRTRPP